jgi:hypothetical protein
VVYGHVELRVEGHADVVVELDERAAADEDGAGGVVLDGDDVAFPQGGADGPFVVDVVDVDVGRVGDVGEPGEVSDAWLVDGGDLGEADGGGERSVGGSGDGVEQLGGGVAQVGDVGAAGDDLECPPGVLVASARI